MGGARILTEEQLDVNALQQKIHETGLFASVKRGDLVDVQKKLALADDSTISGLLQERDTAGATPLLIAFLYQQYDIGKYLVEKYPSHALIQYQNTNDKVLGEIESPYTGENILHIVIVQKNLCLVEWLLNHQPQLIQAMTTGDFFKPGEACYFGGSPFLFAIATNQKEAAELILKIDPTCLMKEDQFGNNALHICIVHDLSEMYNWVMNQLYISVASTASDSSVASIVASFTEQANSDQLTPLALAAALGNSNMFQHILASRTKIAWSYGPVTSKMIELQGLERPSVVQTENGTLKLAPIKTAVECLCAGRTRLSCCIPSSSNESFSELMETIYQSRLDMLMLPEVKQLLDKKWNFFGKKRFLRQFVVVLLYLFLFTITKFLAHYRRSTEDSSKKYPLEMSILTALEIFLAISAAFKLIQELQQVFVLQTQYWNRPQGSARLENLLSWVIGFMVILLLLARMMKDTLMEDIILSFLSLVTWTYLSFFLLGLPSTGPFVLMIKQMIWNDIRLFVVVYMAVVCAFTGSFYVLVDKHGGVGSYFYRMKDLVLINLAGEINFEEYSKTDAPGVSTALLFAYILITIILLLNLLIAMMGKTYDDIYAISEKRWYVERANIMQAFEFGYSVESMDKLRSMYAVELVDEANVEINEEERNIETEHQTGERKTKGKRNARKSSVRMKKLYFEIRETDPLWKTTANS